MLDTTLLTILALGYLIGSLPFGLILCQLAGHGDIRKIGSGNIGATNVLRTGNKPLALATLILDSFKGAAAVIMAYAIAGSWDFNAFGTWACLAGAAAILGHTFPVWLKFKGGKGVATTLGILLAVMPVTGFIACGVWLLSAGIARISSLAALSAMIIAPAASYLFYGQTPAIINAAISLLVIIRHKDNIKRIFKGAEPRIAFGKK